MDSFSIQNYFKRGKTVVLTLRQGDDEQARQWSDKDTTELLKLMNVFLPEFQNQRRRKKEVWVDVAKQLQDFGYVWTPEDCRKKWSNMIRTFKGIEEQKHDPTSNMKRVKWPFYDVMLELLTLNGSDAFPEALTVVQLLNSGNSAGNISSGGFYTRKSPFKALPQSSKCTIVQQVEDTSSQSQQSEHNDPLQIGPGSSVMMVPDHGGVLTDGTEIQTADSNIVFSDSSRYREPAQNSSFPLNRHSLAVRTKKKPFKNKSRKAIKKICSEESTDSVLEKFIESTNRQNEQMLEKITQFHENALVLMQERNDLLRDIRDGLQEDKSGDGVQQTGTCHPNDTETLTLHMGPAFSTSATNATTNSNVTSQLNPALVISTDPAGTSLSTFHLEDGTVISGLNASQEKTVLSNLDSFSESMIPEVSLANLGSILHPTLVSVVSHPSDNSTSLTLAVPSDIHKKIKPPR